MKDETWLPIEGYEGSYDISSAGRVRCKSRYLFRLGRGGELHIIYRTAKLITPKKRGEYLSVALHSPTGKKNYNLHRLVAEGFLDNSENLPEVNHKNENKYDNRVENLEWCSTSYNLSYSKSKPCHYKNPEGEKVLIVNHKKFCRENGLHESGLWRIRTGLSNSHKGWSLWH